MAVSTFDWEALQRVIAGDVVFPGSAAYDKLPKPFNARFHDVRPRAIVRCATPHDVAEAVLFVGRHGLECATRGGGHCFAGRSVSRGVVIDVSPMDAVSVSGGVPPSALAHDSAGCMSRSRSRASRLPAGTCPAVGVAGLTLGGGLGILGETRANLRSPDRGPDRPSGWSSGPLRRHPRGGPVLGASRSGRGQLRSGDLAGVPRRSRARCDEFPPCVADPHAAAVFEAWQEWAPVGPDELAASMKVTAAAEVDRPASVDVYGALLGTESDVTELLDELVVRAGSGSDWMSAEQMSFADEAVLGGTGCYRGRG